MTRPLMLTLLALSLGACASPGEGWWNVTTDVIPSPDGGAGDDEDGADDDGPGSEAFVWGEGDLSDGLFSGEGGYSVINWTGEDGFESCAILWQWSTVRTLEDCSDCSVAFELSASGLVIAFEEDDGCADAPSPLEGSSWRIGVNGEELMLDRGDGWQEAGYAEREEDFLYFEVFTESSEGDDDDDDGGDER